MIFERWPSELKTATMELRRSKRDGSHPASLIVGERRYREMIEARGEEGNGGRGKRLSSTSSTHIMTLIPLYQSLTQYIPRAHHPSCHEGPSEI